MKSGLNFKAATTQRVNAVLKVVIKSVFFSSIVTEGARILFIFLNIRKKQKQLERSKNKENSF